MKKKCCKPNKRGGSQLWPLCHYGSLWDNHPLGSWLLCHSGVLGAAARRGGCGVCNQHCSSQTQAGQCPGVPDTYQWSTINGAHNIVHVLKFLISQAFTFHFLPQTSQPPCEVETLFLMKKLGSERGASCPPHSWRRHPDLSLLAGVLHQTRPAFLMHLGDTCILEV